MVPYGKTWWCKGLTQEKDRDGDWTKTYKNHLLGGIPYPSHKYEFVSLDDYSQQMETYKTL